MVGGACGVCVWVLLFYLHLREEKAHCGGRGYSGAVVVWWWWWWSVLVFFFSFEIWARPFFAYGVLLCLMFNHVFNHFAGNLWACQLPGLYNAQVQQNTAPMIRPHAPRGALLDTDTETQIDTYLKDVWVTMGGQWNSIPHKVPWQ